MTEIPRIALFRPFPDEAMTALREKGDVVQVDAATASDPLSPWSGADAAFVSAFDPVPRSLLDAASRLRCIASVGAGLDHIDLDACAERGIVVRNTPRATINPTADHIFGLLLATARGIVDGDAFVRSGGWTSGASAGFGLDVSGRTIGIIGLGRIGQAIARRAASFDMVVSYHDRAELADGTALGFAARWRPLDDLLAESDFLLLQAPLLPETYHMIGARQLARMKPHAVLINGGRGGLVDEDALADALEAGTIARAALDVFEGEPDINPRLLSAPNLVMTPHLGTATLNSRREMMREALSNLSDLLANR